MKSNYWKFISTILLLSTTIFNVLAQNTHLEYIGLGYNISYAPLRRVNEFIDLYNASKTKINGSIIEQEMNHIHNLKGINFTAGVKTGDVTFDISWTKRANEVFANYETPSHEERHVKYRTSTFGLGIMAPFIKNEKFSANAGMSLDIMSGKLQTYLFNESPSGEFADLNSFVNLGFEPAIQLRYHPIEGIPLDLGCRLYWQANLMKNDMSGLEKEMYNHWKSDISELKSGGSNVGIIFQALIIIPNFKIKPIQKKEKVMEEQKYPSKIKFTAFAIDSLTQKPIHAVVTITNKSGVKTSASIINGEGMSTNLFNNDEYQILVEAFGYESKTDLIALNSFPYSQINKQYALSMIKVGATVTLNNIYFEKASATLLSESAPELDKILDFMTKNPLVSIELSGHTSSEGRDDYNLQLSTERALAIKQWLVSKGIDSKRITSIGYGKTKPIADNNNEEGRKMNRRVELKIIKIE